VVDRRHLQFAVAVAVLVVGLVAIVVATRGNRASSSLGGHHHLGPKPAIAGKPSSSASDVTRAVARQFVAVYLRYERGELTSRTRRAISRLCAQPFRSELLDQPARVPPAARPPLRRVRHALEPSPNLIAGAAGVAVPVALEGPGEESPHLMVDLLLTARGWRVNGIER
jgi:hypothetical protein